MKTSEQKLVEKKSNLFFYKITNEIRIPLNDPPKIFYIKRDDKFKDLPLRNKIFDDFNLVKYSRESLCSPINLAILTGSTDDSILAEEVGHYINFKHMCADFIPSTPVGSFYFGAFSEMLGYFSSKLIDDSRINEFSEQHNPLDSKNKIDKIFDIIDREFKLGFYSIERLININGYSMGEKMFNKYISKKIKKDQISDAFTKQIDSDIGYMHEFYRWRSILDE